MKILLGQPGTAGCRDLGCGWDEFEIHGASFDVGGIRLRLPFLKDHDAW